MTLTTIGANRPRLSLQYGRTPTSARHELVRSPTLNPQELRRIVAETIG
jgi:hypothetical protein